MTTKKAFQNVIGKIRKENGGIYPKAMMTMQQMMKNTATVNCGGEWLKAEETKKIAIQVIEDNRFKTFLQEYNGYASLERTPFDTIQIRIHFEETA